MPIQYGLLLNLDITQKHTGLMREWFKCIGWWKTPNFTPMPIGKVENLKDANSYGVSAVTIVKIAKRNFILTSSTLSNRSSNNNNNNRRDVFFKGKSASPHN
jgi:hypothetical protein